MLRFRGSKNWLLGLFTWGIWMSGVAHAQDLPCNEPFSSNDFITKMNTADAALTEFNIDSFRTTLSDIQDLLPCTHDRIHPNLITRYARQMAMSYFLDQDEMTMAQWGTLAMMNVDLPWPASLEDETHPFRDSMSFIEEPWINGPEGAGLNPPKGGAILMDGKLLLKPLASAETPHFIQLVDKRGLVAESFWQDGSGFAHRLLQAEAVEVMSPSWYEEPDMSLDPTKVVELTDAEKSAMEKLRAAAEAEKKAEEERLAKQYAEQEERAKKLEAIQQKQDAKRKAQEEKRRKKQMLAQANMEASLEDSTPVAVRAPEAWVDFVFDGEKADLRQRDQLETVSTVSDCAELLKMEPRALLGRLQENEIQCLEHRLRHTPRLTMRDKISRVLMADAWAKNLPHRWEAAIRRHLTEIDRSDADLCFIYARHLAKGGVERVRETIRWTDTALENARRNWKGDILITRVYSLHRMRALAAQQMWFEVEQQFLVNTTDRALLDRASRWRNITKSYAREWLEFSGSSEQNMTTPFQVCVSAAGTEDFCRTSG